jgi:hypothetical protein
MGTQRTETRSNSPAEGRACVDPQQALSSRCVRTSLPTDCIILILHSACLQKDVTRFSSSQELGIAVFISQEYKPTIHYWG